MTGIRVLIWGSCVTRDVIEFDSYNTTVLVEYFARSSIAGFDTKAVGRKVDCSGISSNFQRRVVEFELNKSFSNFVIENDFDVLCIDLIDERFGLLASPEKSLLLSRSNELLLTDVETVYSELELIYPLTDEFFALWERGWERFCNALRSTQCLGKVLVSKVYWSALDSDGESLDYMYRKGWINLNNEFLERLYKRMVVDLDSSQFITFDKDDLIADKNHKWGLSPFHYNSSLYLKILEGIKKFYQSRCLDADSSVLVYEITNVKVDETTKVHSINDQLLEYTGVPYLNRFLDIATSDELIFSYIKDSLEKNSADIVSPLTGNAAQLCCTVFLSGRNFLIFKDGGRAFVVVQHHKFCRAIYIPRDNVLIKFDDIDLPNKCLNEMSSFLNDNFELFVSKVRSRASQKCSGLFVSYGRPYHYFYDALPVSLQYFEKLSDFHSVSLLKGGSFFPVDNLHSSSNTQEFSNAIEYSRSLLKNNLFCINPGYAKSRGVDFKQHDEVIVERSIAYLSDTLPDLAHKLNQASDVIWFGICSEKRNWKEQVNVIRNTIKKLLQKKKNPIFVFDGLTSTTDVSVIDFKESCCVDESNTLRVVVQDLIGTESYVDLIGERAVVKVAVASYVTLFLTSFLTDSMYVARFNKKRGVAFGANKAMHSDHYHPNTVFVPQSWVSDDEEGSRNWSEISYFINPGYMEALLTALAFECHTIIRFSNMIFDEKSDVTLNKSVDGLVINSSLDDGHRIVPLHTDGEALPTLPKGKDVVLSLRGRSERYLSTSIVLTLVDKATAEKSTIYLQVGKSVHVPYSQNERSVDIKLRLKGIGTAEIYGLDMVYLEIPSEKMEQNDTFVECSLDDLPATLNSISQQQLDINCSQGNNVLQVRFVPQQSDQLLVFFHSALTRTAKTTMPAFAGNGAIGTVNANILMISDPCITNDNSISLAWFAGTETFKCQTLIRDVISCFANKFGTRKLAFFGGSGGGFASLYYGQFFKDSISVAANPQTNISLYLESSVHDYLKTCFPSIAISNSKQALLQTNIDFVVKAEASNKVLYLQNCYDGHHLNNHLPAYFGALPAALPETGVFCANENTTVYLSEFWGKGNVAPPRTFIFELLATMFKDDFHWEALPEVLLELDSKFMSLIEKVILELKDGKLVAKILPSPRHNGESSRYAFYLLRNGDRIEYITYQLATDVIFNAELSNDLYQVVGFAQNGDKKTVVKSNKFKVEK